MRHRKSKRRGANELSIKLLRRAPEIASEPGDLVDPFGGGGSTYAAAEEMHRNWLGAELGDCDAIIRRLRGEESAFVCRAGRRGQRSWQPARIGRKAILVNLRSASRRRLVSLLLEDGTSELVSSCSTIATPR